MWMAPRTEVLEEAGEEELIYARRQTELRRIRQEAEKRGDTKLLHQLAFPLERIETNRGTEEYVETQCKTCGVKRLVIERHARAMKRRGTFERCDRCYRDEYNAIRRQRRVEMKHDVP